MKSKIVILVVTCFISTSSLAIAASSKSEKGNMDMGNYSPMGAGQKASAAKDSQTEVWVCPMKHYEGPNTKDGKCPKCGMNLEKKAVSKEEKLVCPVSDEKANKKYSLEYKGKTYYFCCEKCIKKFKVDPEKYLKGEKKEEKQEHQHDHN